MKTLLVLVAVLWGLILTAEPALAGCTTQTVWLPDGRVMTCYTCGNQTTCY